jgi:phosphoglycerate dehydrogenase-like enzyme
MPKLKVLCIWKVNEELKNYLQNGLKNYPDVEILFPNNISESNLIGLAEDAHIIIGWRPTEQLLNAALNLKLFINPGAGVQHQIELFRKVNKDRNIALANGHGNAYFTAQHGVALLLTLMNKIVPHHNWMQQGKWRLGDNEARSIPLRDCKIGFLGYGNVNRNMHKMLQGFNVEFAAVKRCWDQKPDLDLNQFELDDLDDFLRFIDILICAVPLTSKTKNMVTSKELKLLGKNGLLVNLSRGAVINESDLYHSLQNEVITGAALDVWYNYQPEPDDEGRKFPASFPFHKLENVILSPHQAASPFNDLKRWDEVIENISRLANNRSDFLNVVELQREY